MLRITLFLFCIVGTGSCAYAEKGTAVSMAPAGVYEAYHAGQSVLLFHVAAAIESEAYFDWYSTFSDFHKSQGKGFYFQQLDPAYLPQFLPNLEDIKEFSIFLKKGRPAYLYSGIILEPQVYQAVVNVYAGNELSDIDRVFLPQQVNLLNFTD